MIKELFLTASALTSMGVPVRSSQVRSNEQETTIEEEQGYSVIENGMKIHYRYETNEVNSVDDLVVGRAYHFNIVDDTLDSFMIISNTMRLNLGFFNIDKFDFHNYSVDTTMDSSYLSDNDLILNLQAVSTSTSFVLISEYEYGDILIDNYFTSLDDANFTLVGDFIFYDHNNIDANAISSFISKCENIPIDYVERVYPTNLMGNIASFIDDYLLSGIPLIDSVTGSINGTNVTMRAWLCSMICIVIACLFIWLAIIFIKWLFKLMSGCFNRL